MSPKAFIGQNGASVLNDTSSPVAGCLKLIAFACMHIFDTHSLTFSCTDSAAGCGL